MTSLSEAQTKTRNELPTRIKNILPPFEYLEHRYRQSNQAIADGSAALLKAQLKAGHHTLTLESWKAVVKKYDWQFCHSLHYSKPDGGRFDYLTSRG